MMNFKIEGYEYIDAELSYYGALAIYKSMRNDLGRVTALLRLGDA